MSLEFITIVVSLIIIILTVISGNNQLRSELRADIKSLNDRMDKLEAKQDDNFKTLMTRIDTVHSELSARIDKVQSELSIRIDNVNSRLDSLYRELFKKAA